MILLNDSYKNTLEGCRSCIEQLCAVSLLVDMKEKEKGTEEGGERPSLRKVFLKDLFLYSCVIVFADGFADPREIQALRAIFKDHIGTGEMLKLYLSGDYLGQAMRRWMPESILPFRRFGREMGQEGLLRAYYKAFESAGTLIVVSDDRIQEHEKMLHEHFLRKLELALGLRYERSLPLAGALPSPDREFEAARRSVIDPKVELLLGELGELVGLGEVKEEVTALVNLLTISKIRKQRGGKELPVPMHLVFTGNPGTGKTTVARLLARIYKELGVVRKGSLVEVDRGGLVGRYVGETPYKTGNVIKEAMGGILFIDEAYSLTVNRSGNDFGYEAVDTLVKAMEDHRGDFIVIAAGYPEPMKRFLESNRGLQSRFNKFIHFDDYQPLELKDIFLSMASTDGYRVDAEGQEYLTDYFEMIYDRRDESFSNGRYVRNVYEQTVMKQAGRLAKCLEISDEELYTITLDDLESSTHQNKQKAI